MGLNYEKRKLRKIIKQQQKNQQKKIDKREIYGIAMVLTGIFLMFHKITRSIAPFLLGFGLAQIAMGAANVKTNK